MLNTSGLLGKEYRDVVTGFQGTVVSKIDYLTGCTQYCLSPKVGEDGKVKDGEYFDVNRLEYVGPGITNEVYQPAPAQQTERTGGPNRDAPRTR